jgi:hypothetical protein
VLEKTRQNIDIFIPQQSLNHFEKSQNTEFQAHYAFWDRKKIKLSPSIDPQPVKSLEFEALSSLHGGAIPSQYSRVERDNSSTLEPLAATYQIRQDLKEKTIDLDGEKQITHGQVYVSKGASKSMILGWAKDFYLLTRKELGLN